MKTFRIQALIVPHNGTQVIPLNYLVESYNADACEMEFKSYNKDIRYYAITSTSTGDIEKLFKKHY